MATDGTEEVVCNLVEVGTIELEDADPNPIYSSLVVLSSEMLIVIDIKEWNLRLHRCQDGKLLAISHKMETWPSDVCLINDTKVAMILVNGWIEIMSVNSVGQPATITSLRTLYVNEGFDRCFEVKHLKFTDNLLVSGRKLDSMCWGIVSLKNGLADPVHRICKYGVYSESYLDTSPNDTRVYICIAGPDNVVYGFDVSTFRGTFVYRHHDLNHPTGISVDRRGFIYVCNGNPSCIHQLRETGELVTVHSEGMPYFPWAMYWEQQKGELFITSSGSNVVRRFRPGKDGGLLSKLKRKFFGRFKQKSHQKHSQESPGTFIPMEILHMDDTSLQLYKEALQDGKEKVYNIRVMVVGQHGVGKTTLTKRLLGQQVDISKRKSTEGIDVYQHNCKISLETGEWILQQKDSDQLSRLHRLRRLLTNQAESAEVSGEKEGHSKVVNQREMIPEEDFSGPVHDSDSDDDSNRLSSSESDVITSIRPKESFALKAYQRDTDLEASSVTVLERKGHVTSNNDDTMVEFLQLVNENADKLEKSIVAYAALGMWDFAGQYAFYTTHQTFLTCRAIYLLVTDLTQQVTDHVKDDCYFDIQGARLCKVQDLVKVWLNSIHSCAPFPAAGTLVTSPAAGAPLTLPATDTPVTSLAADIPVTSPTAGNIVTSLAVGTAVRPLEASSTLTSLAASTPLISAAAGTSVTSAAGNTLTSPAVAIAVTPPEAGITVTSTAAGTPVTSPDVVIPAIPPVILVGTHKDKIPEDKHQEVISKYFQQICYILNEKPAFQHLVDFFAIDNTHFDPELETLKKRIFQLASEQSYWGEEVPANWLLLEEVLMKLKASGIKIIPLSLVKDLNQAGSVPIKTAEQLDLFLRFQHATGTILYFSVEGLKEWIVLDAQWLIDAMKSLIATDIILFKNNPAILGKWFEFKEKGKLTPELIDAIWTNEKSPEFHFYKETILQLMEKLNILARPRLYCQDAEEIQMEDYFLAPFMLHEATPKELISPGPNAEQDRSSVLCFVFTNKFLPSPIFHRLLAACVAHWPIAKQNSSSLIFCGCCVFELDHYHRLTLYFKDYVIFAKVTRMGATFVCQFSELCRKAREFIFENLSKIIGNLGHSLQFVPHIQCPDSDSDSLEGLIAVSLLQKSEKVPCYSHSKSHTLVSTELLKFWFKEEEHSDDESSACPMPAPSTSDTNRFMCIAYLLVDIGSQVLRRLLSHHLVTSTNSLGMCLNNNKGTIKTLHKSNVLNESQMDILFPPNGHNTNLDDYDITLLLILLFNIVPSLSQQEKSMMQSLRGYRNILYGHATSCKMNASDYQTCWNSIRSTLITLSQQCGDQDFEFKILHEIQGIQVSTIPAGSYFDILKTWFSRIETVEGSVETVRDELQALTSRVDDLEKKKADHGREELQ